MIANLEWTQSNEHRNIEHLQNPIMGVTINNESTTTDLHLITESSQTIGGEGGGGLKCIYWYQIFALDSAVVEAQKMLSSHGGFLSIAM